MGSGIHKEEVSLPGMERISGRFGRHDLVDISEEGRKELAAQVWSGKGLFSVDSWPTASVRAYCKRVLEHGFQGVSIPGIVRRFTDSDRDFARELYGEVMPDVFAAVGFVIPFSAEYARIRVPCVLQRRHVARRTTPEQVARLPFAPRTPALAALSIIKDKVKGGPCPGVWGSCALEIYTGLPYTDSGSDLDISIAGLSLNHVVEVAKIVDALEKRFSIKIDVEVQLKGGWGVNGRELLSSGDTILAKGIYEVRLFQRKDVLQCIAAGGSLQGLHSEGRD